MKKNSKLPFIYLTIITVLTYIPVLVAIIYSFNESKSSSVWSGFTLKWYREVFADGTIADALLNSILLGLLAAVLACAIVSFASFALRKRSYPLSKFVKWVGMVPMMIPEVIFGMAYLAFFRLLNMRFGMLTLIIAHMSFCIPYAFLQIEPRMARLDMSQLEAARIMGAGPVRAFVDVVIPFLRPSLTSAMFLSFAMSFDDVVLSMFVTGVSVNTVALKIYSQVKTALTPKVNALCTLMFAGTMLCMACAGLISKKNNIQEE